MNARRTANLISQIDQSEQRFATDAFPTLQELASYRVVFAIWFRFIEERSNVSNDPCDITLCFDRLLRYYFEIPETIMKHLESCLYKVCKEMEYWTCSFSVDKRLFGEKSFHVRPLKPQECFWLSNGKLDYKKTIPKWLSERALNEVQKFTIMCEYCFEDDIRKFALESLPSEFMESVDFYTNRFVYYWVRYLKDELHEIPVDVHNSVDFMMASTCDVTSLLALRYFWDHLSETDQVALAVSKLQPDRWKDVGSYDMQDHILSMMSFKQQRCLLSKIPDAIILNFWILHSLPSISWAWQHSIDVMTGYQFSKLVIRVFDGNVFYHEDPDRLPMLIEMWDNAPNHLKNETVEHIEDKIVKRIEGICVTTSPPLDMYKFLYKVLLVKDVDDRRNFLLKSSIALGALIVDPTVMNDIVNLCLPNPDDQLTYVETIIHSNKFKVDLAKCLKNSRHDNIDLRISYYTTNEQAAREYKRNYLLDFNKLDRAAFIFNPATWKTLAEYIDVSFPNFAEASKVKNDFVVAFARYVGDYWESGMEWGEPWLRKILHFWNDVDSFVEFTMFADKLFIADGLETLKLTLLTSFQRVITGEGYYWPFYDDTFYRKFLMWCVDYDEQAFAKFKTDNIRPECIFNGILHTSSEEYHIQPMYKSTCGYEEIDEKMLAKIDNLLIWCFDGSVERKSEYKRKRMLEYDRNARYDIPIIETIDDWQNEDNMDMFLNWAFENDKEAVRKFMKDNKISYDYLHEDSDNAGNHMSVVSFSPLIIIPNTNIDV